MDRGLRDRLAAVGERTRRVVERAQRVEHRELREFRRWVERTSNLVHLSVLVFVPVLIAVVTALFNAIEGLSFLLFPPLASGTYTLFADPEGRYASPVKFVAGLTVGALCGWGALATGTALGLTGGIGVLSVSAVEAAIAVFAAGVATWALNIEEPAAYSTALLGLLVPVGDELLFTLSVFLASSVVATVFFVWRERFYERRAQFLYESTMGDDHVLVPMRGENPDATAMFGARLAAAHDAGKVVLLDLVDDADVAAVEREMLAEGRRADRSGGRRAATDGGRSPERSGDDDGEAVAGTPDAGPNSTSDPEDHPNDSGRDHGEQGATPVEEAVSHLEMQAGEIETRVGVPCQVVVAVAGRSPAGTVLKTAREVNCDLVAAPYEQRHGGLSPYLKDLFGGGTDVLVHRSRSGRTRWKRVLVPVRQASDVAHGMLDFAARLAGRSGRVSVATCISDDNERERRRAEAMLADLVEAFERGFETRVSTLPIETFLAENADAYDLLIMGASTDRSAASRLISPPTFERIQDVDADVAILDRK